MHSRVIILTKSKSKEEAEDNARDFLDGYTPHEIDWYVIGGRWSGLLNKEYNDFRKRAVKDLEAKAEDENLATSIKNIEDNEEMLQEIWEEEFGKSNLNPLNRDTYNNGYDDDVMKAENCKERIKEIAVDRKEMAEQAWKKGLEEKEKEENGKAAFPEVYMEDFANWRNDMFSFDSRTYDIDLWTNDLPEDLSDYYAVVVDMHT